MGPPIRRGFGCAAADGRLHAGFVEDIVVERSGQTTLATPAGVVIGDDEADFGTISVLSLVSLVLGLAAPLCVLAPLLYAIPIAGAAVSLLAIGRIAASGGALIGRKAATIALALCVASASAAWAHTALANALFSRQARQAALEWFELVQAGELRRAFDRTVASTQSPPPPPPVNSLEASAGPAPDPFQQFCDHPVVKRLPAAGQGREVVYVRDLGFDAGVRGDRRIRQEFSIGNSADSSDRSAMHVQLTMQRTRSDSATPNRWLVSDLPSEALGPQSGGQ
jgi:hypothetical protein